MLQTLTSTQWKSNFLWLQSHQRFVPSPTSYQPWYWRGLSVAVESCGNLDWHQEGYWNPVLIQHTAQCKEEKRVLTAFVVTAGVKCRQAFDRVCWVFPQHMHSCRIHSEGSGSHVATSRLTTNTVPVTCFLAQDVKQKNPPKVTLAVDNTGESSPLSITSCLHSDHAVIMMLPVMYLGTQSHCRSLVSSVRPQRRTVQPITADRVRMASRMAHQWACRRETRIIWLESLVGN